MFSHVGTLTLAVCAVYMDCLTVKMIEVFRNAESNNKDRAKTPAKAPFLCLSWSREKKTENSKQPGLY